MTDINAVIERLEKADKELQGLHAIQEERVKHGWSSGERTRLAGKIEGVRLALSYLREEQ
ncbi:hypothetical protein [Mycobacteroides chelonae]|uniref:hypothetical protein n=1 Tax=Mycobacteroides chelonae TaxID=1774 RepID=UPI000D68D397|nr:hypothetical protein [Mycobacteroides chelonae]